MDYPPSPKRMHRTTLRTWLATTVQRRPLALLWEVASAPFVCSKNFLGAGRIDVITGWIQAEVSKHNWDIWLKLFIVCIHVKIDMYIQCMHMTYIYIVYHIFNVHITCIWIFMIWSNYIMHLQYLIYINIIYNSK